MSISRRDGCQSASVAPRYDEYLPAVSTNEAGIAGTPSTTKFSPGAIAGSCAYAGLLATENSAKTTTSFHLLVMLLPILTRCPHSPAHSVFNEFAAPSYTRNDWTRNLPPSPAL